MNECNLKNHDPQYRSFEWALSYMKSGGRVRHRDSPGEEIFFDTQMCMVASNGRVEGKLSSLLISDIVDDAWAPVPAHGSWDWAMDKIRSGKTVTRGRWRGQSRAYMVKSPQQFDSKDSATRLNMAVSRALNASDFKPFVVTEHGSAGIFMADSHDAAATDWEVIG